MIGRLVSGGQTRVDRAALNAALELGVPCGGWCPKGRKAEDGGRPRPLSARRDAVRRLRLTDALEHPRLGRDPHPVLGDAELCSQPRVLR